MDNQPSSGSDTDSQDPTQPEQRECHRRGCSAKPAFRVRERYLEETGQGPVEATALLCQAHADEESPTNLDDAYDDYIFLVEPI